MKTLKNQLRLECNYDSSDNLLIDPHGDGKVTVGINVSGEFPHVLLTNSDIIKLKDYLDKLLADENNK